MKNRIFIGIVNLTGTDSTYRETGETAFRFTEYERTSSTGKVYQYEGDKSGYYIEVEGVIIADNHDNECFGRRTKGKSYVGEKATYTYFVRDYNMDWTAVSFDKKE